MPNSNTYELHASGFQLQNAVVRKYGPEDRDAVRGICYETGMMGHPIAPYFGCYELFADYWMNYYTDYEPESAFVAELDSQVVGYLVGCRETSQQEAIQADVIVPQIRRKFLTLGYKVDKRFFSFMWRYIRSMLRGEFARRPVADYPAHLHMNLMEGYRSGGIGSRLLSTFTDYLREKSTKGLHLGTTTYNKLAVPFYQKRGFNLVSRHPFTLYEGIIPEKIDLLFFTRKLI
jgi:GNAT superfamily N-acetyltransferase